jgi:hypothetical protein
MNLCVHPEYLNVSFMKKVKYNGQGLTQTSALECLWKGELCLFVFRGQLSDK